MGRNPNVLGTSGIDIRSMVTDILNMGKELDYNIELIQSINNQFENIPYVPFPIAFHTVDVIATRYNPNLEILLGKKPKNDKWVFIGGFVEPTHTAEHTAVKEFHEEAGLLIEDEDRFKYLGSAFIDDDRYKESCHKITTSLFTINLTAREASEVRAGDDIEFVQWFKAGDVYGNLKELHKELFAKFLIKKAKV